MRKLSILLVLVLVGSLVVFPMPARAGGSSSYWVKSYGGSGWDAAYAVAVAENGDVIVAGVYDGHDEDVDNDGYNEWVADVWVLRLDANGNVKWQKTYGGSDWDRAWAVAVAENGDVIVAGVTDSFGAGGDVWVLRLPQDGNLPYCDFCSNSNANISTPNVQVSDSSATVQDTNANVQTTNVHPESGTLTVKTQYISIGTLSVTTNPSGAEVYINGTYAGTTPLTTNLSVGTYEVTLKLNNYEDYTTSVTIKPSEETTLNVELTPLPAHLTINSNPSGAAVYLNGTYIGDTPIDGYPISPGVYSLGIAKRGYVTYITKITVEADKTTEVTVTLAPSSAIHEGSGNVSWQWPSPSSVSTVDTTPDGKYVVVGSGNDVYLLEGNGSALWSFRAEDAISDVAITPDGSMIVAGSVDHNVYAFNRNGELLWMGTTKWEVWSVAVSDDGRYVVVGSRDASVYVFDGRTGELLWRYPSSGGIPSNAGVLDVEISGNYIAAGTQDGKLYLLGTDGTLLWSRVLPGEVRDIALSANAEYIAVGSYSDYVYLFTKSGGLLWTYYTGNDVGTVAITSNGNEVFAGNWNGHVYKLSKGGKLLWEKNLNNGGVTKVLLTPDGKYAIAGTQRGLVVLFDSEGNVIWANSLGSRVWDMTLARETGNVVIGADKVYYMNPIEEIQMKADAENAIQQAENLINYAVNHGINVSDAENMLNIAKSEYSSGLYSAAKEHADQAYNLTQEAISQAKEDAWSAIEDANETINQARTLGLNTSMAESLLSKALENYTGGYYPTAEQIARNAENVAMNLLKRYNASVAIENATEIIKMAKEAGANTTYAEDLLNQAREALNSGDYTKAQELAEQAKLAAMKAEAEAVIKDAETTINETVEKGIDVSEAQLLLNQAKEALNNGEYKQAKEYAQKAKESCLNTLAQVRTQATESINAANQSIVKAEGLITSAEDAGIDTKTYEDKLNKAREMLSTAVDLYNAGRYTDAITKAESARTKAEAVVSSLNDKLQSYREEALNRIAEANETITWAVKHGLDIGNAKNVLNEAVEKLRGGLYLEASTLAMQALNMANKTVENYRIEAENEIKLANETIENVSKTLSTLEKLGFPVDEEKNKLQLAMSVLDSARTLYSEGKYPHATTNALKARNSALSILGDLKEVEKTYSENVINRVTANLTSLQNGGIGCPSGNSTLRLARERFNKEEYREALNLAVEALGAIDQCREEGTSLKKDIESVLSETEDMKKKGCPVSDIEESLNKALEYLKAGNFTASRGELQNARNTLNERENRCNEVLADIDQARKAIDSAKSLGLDPSEAENLLNEAVEKLRNGDFESAKSFALNAAEKARDVDGDGILNEEDPFPSINNYILYGAAGIVLLLLITLVALLVRRQRLRRLYGSIVTTVNAALNGLIPEEAEENRKALESLLESANREYRKKNRSELQRIKGEVLTHIHAIEEKRREYSELKEAIIREIDSLLNPGQTTAETANPENAGE